MKTVITHLNPDLDAMTSVWLIKRFLPGWSGVEVRFVPAGIDSRGIKYKAMPTGRQVESIKENDEVLVVDTGFGELDHHQTDKKTCAAKLVWSHIKSKIKSQKSKVDKKAIDRLVNVVLRIDYSAEDITTANAADDFFTLLFNERQIIRGLRTLYRGQSDKHLEIGLTLLDAVYEVLKAKIAAEEIIKNGVKFSTRWGKAIGCETSNEMYMHLAQEMGYNVVVAKDPKKGHVRIHALPRKGIDFTGPYEILKKKDAEATWYLHSSKALLLNGSSANPDMKPTRLGLEEIIEVLKIK